MSDYCHVMGLQNIHYTMLHKGLNKCQYHNAMRAMALYFQYIYFAGLPLLNGKPVPAANKISQDKNT